MLDQLAEPPRERLMLHVVKVMLPTKEQTLVIGQGSRERGDHRLRHGARENEATNLGTDAAGNGHQVERERGEGTLLMSAAIAFMRPASRVHELVIMATADRHGNCQS